MVNIRDLAYKGDDATHEYAKHEYDVSHWCHHLGCIEYYRVYEDKRSTNIGTKS